MAKEFPNLVQWFSLVRLLCELGMVVLCEHVAYIYMLIILVLFARSAAADLLWLLGVQFAGCSHACVARFYARKMSCLCQSQLGAC